MVRSSPVVGLAYRSVSQPPLMSPVQRHSFGITELWCLCVRPLIKNVITNSVSGYNSEQFEYPQSCITNIKGFSVFFYLQRVSWRFDKNDYHFWIQSNILCIFKKKLETHVRSWVQQFYQKFYSTEIMFKWIFLTI